MNNLPACSILAVDDTKYNIDLLVDAGFQHFPVADLVGQEQDQAGVEQLGVFAAEAGVGVEQLFVERVGVLEMQVLFHGVLSPIRPRERSMAVTSRALMASPVAAR